MRRLVFVMLAGLAACGGEKNEGSLEQISRTPLSVRGWIADVKGAEPSDIPDVELARRAQLFQSTQIWVEKTNYATGGVSENGSFVVLDVPSPDATIGFTAPGAENAQLVLRNIPGNADVFVPDVVLEPGGATVLDPKKIVVRVAARVSKETPTNQTAIVAGHNVPVVQVPVAQMTNRRDFPNPGGFRPVATVRD